MKKRNALLSLILIIFFTAQAQAQFYMGLIGGGHTNGVAQKNTSGTLKSPGLSSFAGFKVGAAMSDTWLYEMEFFQRDYLYTHNFFAEIVNPNGSGFVFEPTKIDYAYRYLTSVVKFTYRTGKQWKFLRTFGMGLSFRNKFGAFAPDIDSPVTNLAKKVLENAITPASFDLSLMAGLGVSYTTGKFNISLEARGNCSLSDHDQSIRTNRKLFHRSLDMVLGVTFILGEE